MGGDGISRAVFVDAGGDDDMERMGPPIAGSWGEVQFQDREGALIGRFGIDEWLPEAAALPKRSVRGEQLLSRTGVTGLLESAGIELHVVRDRNDPLVARRARGRGRGTDLGPGSAFPSWYWGTRASAGIIWFVAFTAIVFSDTDMPWIILVAAAAALVAPVARPALRWWTRRRLRRYVPAVRARISPCPATGAGATVRFRRDTDLRVQERDLVLRDVSGQEFWLARSGPHSVTSLVRVLDRSGAPVGVELRGSDGQIRAVLPWQPWFGGEEGAKGLSELRSASGLPVTDRTLGGKRSGRAGKAAAGAVMWPKGPVLGAGVLPASAREARAESRFPGTIAGASSTAVMAVASFFSVTQGLRIVDAHPGAGTAAILMGALGGVLQATPYVIHQLHSRLRLDRPV